MRYMLLVYSPEDAWTPEEWQHCTVESTELCHELQEQGRFVAASPLHPVATAKSVRVRDGRSLITDGPFAETTEQLGGFFIVDVENIDDALTVAARLPSAKKGTVEVRPIMQLEGLPAERFNAPAPTGPSAHGRYMFLCYDDQQFWDRVGPAAQQEAMREAVALTCELDGHDQYISAAPLHPLTTATSVRVRDKKRLITDGPFAETREFLGGYYVILASSLEEAASFAARHPGARSGTVEVRRLFDLPNMPEVDA